MSYESAPKWTEADLARTVVAELQRQGYETYEEVSLAVQARRADVVGVRGPLVVVVETKAGLSLRLLDQLLAWRGEANLVIGAVAQGRISHAVEQFCRDQGFGLWQVGAGGVNERIAPRLLRRAAWQRLRAALRPEHRSGEYAKAGTNGGGHWSPFRDTCRALRRVVQQHPGIELRVALREIDHHYAGHKSAMGALPGLIRKGVVEGVRLDDDDSRSLRLYPEDQAEATR